MKKNNVPDYVKKSPNYKPEPGVKIINVWIGVFYVAMLTNVMATATFPYGQVNLFCDLIHLTAQFALAVSGVYIIWQIFKRDDMIYENETIKNLIYYKEHSRKQKNFPVSATILIVFGLTMVAILVTYLIIFYKLHID